MGSGGCFAWIATVQVGRELTAAIRHVHGLSRHEIRASHVISTKDELRELVCSSREDSEGMNCHLQLMMGGYGEESGARWQGKRPRAWAAPRSSRQKEK